MFLFAVFLYKCVLISISIFAIVFPIHFLHIGRAASSQCGHCPSITIDSNFNGLPPTTQGVSNGDPRMQMFNLPMGSLNANGSKIFSWKLLSKNLRLRSATKWEEPKNMHHYTGGFPLSKTSPQWLMSLFYGHRFLVCDTRLWIIKFIDWMFMWWPGWHTDGPELVMVVIKFPVQCVVFDLLVECTVLCLVCDL